MRAMDEYGPVNASEFAEIAAAARPAIFRAQVASWPSVAAAKAGLLDRYLRDQASTRAAPCVVGLPSLKGRFFYRDDMRGMNFGRRDAPLGEVLEQLQEQADSAEPLALAMQSAPTDLVLPGFADANRLDLLPESVRPRIWIGNRIHVATHYNSNDNIACVVGGRRRFTLFPPDQAANLYIGSLELTPAGTPVSMVDVDAPDLARYPRFADALDTAMAAELAPGDAIFIPYLWWHSVRSLDPLSVLVNYWWSATPEAMSPVDALLHALVAIRAQPESRRAAWRALFDHLVFDDAAGAHLPVAARGVLGDLPEAERQEIGRQLALKLSGRS
ncbi:cupin-like domain-containing protein [Sphingomonas sp. MMS24-J45]|uniref:cupin-like domain-containing protein n=1 Tax=Sphingomonas sp. MMS24-J45 TaxID=3238806 RepID=UPI00384D4D55